MDPPHCPLVGEYTGVLPDAEGLCAKSYADCNNPEVMFYTVFNCHNHSEIYEEREYRCFGQWEENGLVYTYTERRDIPGNECFVGVTIDEDRNIVTEAGQNCERGHQPEKYGMTLHRQAKCSNNNPLQHGGQGRQSSVNIDDVQMLEEERLMTSSVSSVDRTVSPRHNPVLRVNSTPRFGDIVFGRSGENEEDYRDQDIYTNEIPGSSRSSGMSRMARPSSLVVLVLGLLLTLTML